MKKGFTLIELLAVITVLAIISLIAIPKLVDVIKDSKIEALKHSSGNYVNAVVKELASVNISDNLDAARCKVTNGLVECTDVDGVTRNLEVNVKNSIPTGGYIDFENNDASKYVLCFDNKYSVDEKGTVDNNSTYCKNYNDPNATRYIAKFFVNNTEYLSSNNYDFDNSEYIGFLEGSKELIMPDVPLDKSVLENYSMPVEYVWLTGVYGNLYEPGESYKFINDNINFYSAIYFARPNGYAWNNRYWATYSNKRNIKGSNVYSGVKTRFHLAPGTDDFAYHTAPFIDGTTYTFEELNTTYKDTEFALMSFYSGVDLDKVIGTEIKVFVGDYQNPTRVLADEYYDIDPNSNDDFIISAIDNATGALNTPKTILEAFPSDPYKETYDVARVIRLIIPYDDYKDLTIKYVVTYKDINGGSYIWMSYSDDSLSE